MGKPTVHDIAKEAGVSLATVDRVLNERPGVRDKTVARVRAAVARLGYVRDLSAANLARQREYRFLFVLPEGRGQFLTGLREAVAEAASLFRADRCRIDLVSLPLSDPMGAVGALRGLAAEAADGVAVMANETPMVRDIIARLKARGTAVVALVTDQPNAARDHFVGIDNVAAGRTAGVLMGRFLPRGAGRGVIAVVVNTTYSRDMVERRLGFDAVMAERFPGLTVLPSIEGRGDPGVAVTGVLAAQATQGPLAGVYCAGSGGAAVARAMAARRDRVPPVVLAHDLTPNTRAALADGTLDAVITQNSGHVVRSAVRVLRAKCDAVDIIRSQEQIRIDIVLKENLP